jgi:hypothetical protein
MKLANYIFSMYFIILSCWPCADFDGIISFDSNDVVSVKSNDHSHSNCNDICSPFCSCNCCGNPFFGHQIVALFLDKKNENFIKLPEYKSPQTATYFASIWQPPKMNDVI